MSHWNDESLGESLRRLPEARAGEGFTRAVLARVAETENADAAGDGARRWATWPQLAAVATAVVAVVLTAVLLTAPGGRPATSGEMPARIADAGPVTPGTTGTDRPTASDDRAGTQVEPGAEVEPDVTPATEPGPTPGVGADATPAATPDRLADHRPRMRPEPRPEMPSDTQPERAAGVAFASHGSAAGDGLSAAERRRALARLEELRREQSELRARLAAFTDASAPPPKLVLGGDESLELVLDLAADGGRAPGAGYGLHPATYRPAPEAPRYF